MNLNIEIVNPNLAPRPQEVTSEVQVSTFVVAPPERVWAALRNFDSRSTSSSLKVLYQKSNRRLIYVVSGLPRAVKRMIGQIELQPDGLGTHLRWSVSFSTRPTLFAFFLRLQMRLGIARTLREATRKLNRILDS